MSMLERPFQRWISFRNFVENMPFFSEIRSGEAIYPEKKIFVFGNGAHARTIYGYFFDEGLVEGFVVDDPFVEVTPTLGKLPVYPLSRVRERFPPDEYAALVALAFRDLNQLRKDKSDQLSKLGYEFVTFVDRSVRLPDQFSIAGNSIILGNVDLHHGVSVREGVFVSSGVILGHDSVLQAYSWIGSGTALAGWVDVGEFSVLGMNVSVKQNTKLSHHTLVSPNTFVNKDTAPNSSILSDSGKSVAINSNILHRFSYK
ncbi:MAG: hypothetical protein VKL39_22810 [Leptolyngbyaceae bacterium]|nr:hypothetical protein [Leptolyngbyaceae bacterium]